MQGDSALAGFPCEVIPRVRKEALADVDPDTVDRGRGSDAPKQPRLAAADIKDTVSIGYPAATLRNQSKASRPRKIDSMADLSYRVGQMSREPSIGQFEQLVLTAILAQPDAYGVTIHAKVAELVAPKTVSLGAVYVTLDRLEDKGLISSWLSKPTAARGGRAKRCYQLEALGERALHASAATIHRMHEVLVDEWGGRPWKPARAR